jgi:hypothetical protein
MFGKYNGFVSKARVSGCMYFLVRYRFYWRIEKTVLLGKTNSEERRGETRRLYERLNHKISISIGLKIKVKTSTRAILYFISRGRGGHLLF